MHEIDETDIYEMLRIMNEEKEEDKPVETDSLIAAFSAG